MENQINKEEYKIEIETTGGYRDKKEFNLIVDLTPREYLRLIEAILDYMDNPDKKAIQFSSDGFRKKLA